jgi:hypothetical protein
MGTTFLVEILISDKRGKLNLTDISIAIVPEKLKEKW